MNSRRVPGIMILPIALFVCAGALSQNPPPLTLTKVISLPHVSGRIDHMDIDLKTGRVFVAALGNNSVEVVSLKEGHVIRTLKGFSEPQGVLFLPESNRLYINNGGEGACVVLDGTSLEPVATIQGLDDADNIRYSPSDNLVYVGFGNGGIAAIDPARVAIAFKVPLSAHPEAFQVESVRTRLYVNVPSDGKIVVLDRARRQIVATWPREMKEGGNNFPMALDEAGGRLFIGCRTPPRLLVLNSLTGGTVAALPIGKDVDDVFFDAGRHQVYASCGEGIVDVISQKDPNTYKKISTVATRKGARTSLFVPEKDLFIVAVPASGEADAEVRLYAITGR